MRRVPREYKMYLKLVKQYRKELTKQAKKAIPFDYDAITMFVTFLRFMKDYYSQGNNVHACEVDGHNRFEKISYALSQYDAWVNDEEEYTNAVTSAFYNKRPSSSNKIIVDKEINELAERYNVNSELHWNNFWNTIRDEILFWWD